mmetsp:Transcript_130542/g.317088  ORF Transcript_130542/g.317088 Transcript_130542/m.317088 type:complete len:362 (+) Transcript_130542:203-1288(+)
MGPLADLRRQHAGHRRQPSVGGLAELLRHLCAQRLRELPRHPPGGHFQPSDGKVPHSHGELLLRLQPAVPERELRPRGDAALHHRAGHVEPRRVRPERCRRQGRSNLRQRAHPELCARLHRLRRASAPCQRGIQELKESHRPHADGRGQARRVPQAGPAQRLHRRRPPSLQRRSLLRRLPGQGSQVRVPRSARPRRCAAPRSRLGALRSALRRLRSRAVPASRPRRPSGSADLPRRGVRSGRRAVRPGRRGLLRARAAGLRAPPLPRAHRERHQGGDRGAPPAGRVLRQRRGQLAVGVREAGLRGRGRHSAAPGALPGCLPGRRRDGVSAGLGAVERGLLRAHVSGGGSERKQQVPMLGLP